MANRSCCDLDSFAFDQNAGLLEFMHAKKWTWIKPPFIRHARLNVEKICLEERVDKLAQGGVPRYRLAFADQSPTNCRETGQEAGASRPAAVNEAVAS